KGSFVDEALRAILDRAALGEADAALASELALGVLRHRMTLARLVGLVLAGRLGSLAPALRDILYVGAYQLVFLDRVPAFAAVNEAVRQAKQRGGRKAGALVNAVLRQLLRHRVQPRCPFDQADPRRCVRVDHDRGCVFDLNLFAEPRTDPIGYYSAATSHPPLLVSRWLRHFGPAKASQICWAGQAKPPMSLRANELRIGPDQLAEQLGQAGIKAHYDPASRAVLLADAPPVRSLPAFKAGLCQPQDPTTMSVVRLGGPQPGQLVLDLCAAPGTKTTQLAEQMNNEGLIVACDVNEAKLEQIRQNCRRMGITIVRTALPEELPGLRRQLGKFDLILVDAPCSNSGVLARRPEARYRFSRTSLARLVRLQRQLLGHAADLAESHTRLIYSTCSIEPEENEQLIQGFCAPRTKWSVLQWRLTLPRTGQTIGQWRDGGFVAELVRTR
ncbi:MAG: transcription antitermination factor NusB, partial [Phycisphaerae bacterium]